MKAADVIRSHIRWREDLLKGGPVEHQSLVELHARIGREAPSAATLHEATLPWSEFTSRRMGEKRAIESLMKAIARGDVKAVKHARTLGEMSFRMSDVSQHFGTPLLEVGMSIH